MHDTVPWGVEWLLLDKGQVSWDNRHPVTAHQQTHNSMESVNINTSHQFYI